MKIALWGSYGSDKFPKGFKPNSKDLIEVRESLAAYIEKNITDTFDMEAYEYSERENKLREAIKDSKHKCVKVIVKGKIKYYVMVNNCLGYWELEDIDTSKLWQFGVYDGAEFINYFTVNDRNMLVKVLVD